MAAPPQHSMPHPSTTSSGNMCACAVQALVAEGLAMGDDHPGSDICCVHHTLDPGISVRVIHQQQVGVSQGSEACDTRQVAHQGIIIVRQQQQLRPPQAPTHAQHPDPSRHTAVLKGTDTLKLDSLWPQRQGQWP
jgi:hypothetical protein